MGDTPFKVITKQKSIEWTDKQIENGDNKRIVTLYNTYDFAIDWSVKTTKDAAKLYVVTPVKGIISPQKSQDISVVFKEQKITEQKEERLRFEIVNVNDPKETAKKDIIMIRKLEITQEPPKSTEESKEEGVSILIITPIVIACIIIYMIQNISWLSFLYNPWTTFLIGVITMYFQIRSIFPTKIQRIKQFTLLPNQQTSSTSTPPKEQPQQSPKPTQKSTILPSSPTGNNLGASLITPTNSGFLPDIEPWYI